MADSAAPAAASSDAELPKNLSGGALDAQGEGAIKVILLGDSAVGKSKLVERFLMNDYQPRQLSTYALTLFRHVAAVGGEKVEVDFWDTAGQERFNSMHPAYYHMAHACVLCFDVTRKQTYKNLPDWYKELREYRPGIPVVCIANKIDVDMKVTQKEFGFPKKHNLQVRTHALRLASRPARRARLACRPLWPAAHASMHVRAVLLLFGL